MREFFKAIAMCALIALAPVSVHAGSHDAGT